MKYNVIVTVDVYVDDIEAETREEAINIAKSHFKDYTNSPDPIEANISSEIMEISIDKETP